MNLKTSSSAELFVMAAAELVRRMPYGSQGRIAKAMSVRDGYLSDLLKGKRNWSDKLRDRFALAIGMSAVEIYAIGDNLNRTGLFFPYSSQVANTPPQSAERAARIVLCVLREIHLHLEPLANPEVIKVINSETFKEYAAGRITDGDYYKHAKHTFQKALSHYTLKK